MAEAAARVVGEAVLVTAGEDVKLDVGVGDMD